MSFSNQHLDIVDLNQETSHYIKGRKGARYFSEWNGFCSPVNKVLPLLLTGHGLCTNFAKPQDRGLSGLLCLNLFYVAELFGSW